MARGPLLSAAKRWKPPCPICGKPITRQRKKGVWLKTCGLRRCVRAQQSTVHRRRGTRPTLATVVAKAQRDARMQAVMQFELGTLSARDWAVMKWTWKYAWNRGYQKGLKHQARLRQAEAA